MNLTIFALTDLLLCLTPGPAVLLVISQAMRSNARSSRNGALGILTGNALYFALSATGLGAILLTSHRLFTAIKLAGALYLIFTGLRMALTRPKKTEGTTVEHSHRRHFTDGLITQLANPKAIVFFTALLPQFIDVRMPIPRQFLILGILSLAIELVVLTVYGLLAERGRSLLSGDGGMRWLNGVAGTFLVAAGAKLALVKR